MSILALCPSRGRPDWAKETLASFKATVRDPGSRLVFVVDRDDGTRSRYPKGHTHVVEGGTMGLAIREAGADPAVLKDATSVGMIGDDNRFETPGWDVVFDKWLTHNIGVAYGDDGIQHVRLPTAWWVSRALVDEFNIAPAGLKHLYMDNYWKALGEAAGFLRYFPDVSIPHLHPLKTHGHGWVNTEAADETYKRGNSHQNAMNDRLWFQRWERRGKPGEVRTARAIATRNRKARVFADWHHPALYESLSILFEDRFGWELYSPMGTEWAANNAWNFEHNGQKAYDYLTFRDAKARDGYYVRTEREYPERPRKLVTWDQANAMEWDYVVSSVPSHQRTFADLAKRWGAKAVHQVGNARHPIDSSVRQIVLASANIRHARMSVSYHQEFSRSMFAPAEPVDLASVSSFMMRLETTSCDYSWIASAPGITFRSFGSKPYLSPMSSVAEKMGEAGWIWHDKKIGDGYGHVLFNAAAMGKPLIGHASHFRGLTGEPFWDDLRTCIDLDKHSPLEAARLVRAISNDPEWYCDMSRAILERFDSLVDFDAEALKIKEALA